MLFKQAILDKIAAGQVTVAFRRWKRPTVKACGTLKTPVGVLEIRSVAIIEERQISQKSASRAGFDTVNELLASLGDRGGELYQIEFSRLGDDPRVALREQAEITTRDFQELLTRVGRLDQRSRFGPWTKLVLELIAQFPEMSAGELASKSHFEKAWLKTSIRKLKNLGLTESLAVGYRLSPRGRTFVAAITAADTSQGQGP